MKKIVMWGFIFMGLMPVHAHAIGVLDKLQLMSADYHYSAVVDIATCVIDDSEPSMFTVENSTVFVLLCGPAKDRYIFFFDCINGYYEADRGNRSRLAAIINRYPGFIGSAESRNFFKGFCAPCPTYTNSNGAAVKGKIPADYSSRHGNITDCTVPTTAALSDGRGIYSFNNDCHYAN